MQGTTIFLKIDLRSKYHQLRIKEEGIPKTTFKMTFGDFEYIVVPFGLTNVSSVFTNLINGVFDRYLAKYV